MKKLSMIAATAGLMVLLPAAAEAQQQPDPMLVAKGAQLYTDTCGRCHNARPAAERTDQEWVVIVAHMRARANMSGPAAEAVLAFLQATNAPEGVTRAAAIPTPDSIPRTRHVPPLAGRER